MGNEENCVPANGLSKKRAFASVSAANQQVLSPKKRAVLGELSVNTGNIDLGFDDFSTPEPIVKKTVKKTVDKEDGDLKKCGYSSLIYQYLHSLEVCVCVCVFLLNI